MKTTRSGISVACHWNGKFNISDMLVPAFDYCSSFKSLLTGKVLISKKSCFNEGEMLIANTKSLHIKLSQHCHWFLGDSKAHLCVYTRRHRLLLFYHNISLNVPSNFLREWQLSPQTSHISEAGGVKSDELTSHPNYAIMRRSYNQKYCKKLLNTTSWRKHYKTSSRFSPRNNNSILFSHLWSFAYHIICTVIIVFARQLNHLCHNTQSWHKKKVITQWPLDANICSARFMKSRVSSGNCCSQAVLSPERYLHHWGGPWSCSAESLWPPWCCPPRYFCHFCLWGPSSRGRRRRGKKEIFKHCHLFPRSPTALHTVSLLSPRHRGGDASQLTGDLQSWASPFVPMDNSYQQGRSSDHQTVPPEVCFCLHITC